MEVSAVLIVVTEQYQIRAPVTLGARAIANKWVYSLKDGAKGQTAISREKARLVARGDREIYARY